MKAILVIDMPNCCEECQFCNSHYDFEEPRLLKEYCYITGLEVSGEIISDDCPLRPIPLQSMSVGNALSSMLEAWRKK